MHDLHFRRTADVRIGDWVDESYQTEMAFGPDPKYLKARGSLGQMAFYYLLIIAVVCVVVWRAFALFMCTYCYFFCEFCSNFTPLQFHFNKRIISPNRFEFAWNLMQDANTITSKGSPVVKRKWTQTNDFWKQIPSIPGKNTTPSLNQHKNWALKCKRD